MKSQYFHFQYLSQGVTNIYEYIYQNKNNLSYRDTFNYLPLTYFTFGSISALLKPIMPADYIYWINDWSATQNNYNNFPFFLLILKIPYLILDLLTAYLIYKISRSKIITYYWLLNPISFYLIYILGNFDILPVFLTILSFYLIKKKENLSMLIFGLAIALKLYPLIFLPFYILSITKKPIVIIKLSCIAMIPLLLTIFPFIQSQSFWQSFIGSGLTQKIIELKYQNIPVFPIVYLILLITYLISKSSNLPKYILYIFLLFVSTVHFHPQWILWFFPFMFFDNNIYSKKMIISLIIQFTLIAIYILLFNDSYLSWGHLLPIDREFINITSPYNIIRYKMIIDPKLIQDKIKACISIISFILAYVYEKTNNNI